MDSFAHAIIIEEEEVSMNTSFIKIQRKMLRDACNPLEMDETVFIKNFRLNKDGFKYVLGVLEERSQNLSTSASMTSIQRLASVLRFLAEGSYQHGVGKDFDVPMAQSTFSCVLKDVLQILQARLCPNWIKLDMTAHEMSDAKMEFYRKYRFPGVILCVDGTHIKIISPAKDRFLYFNRKGFYSINAMIICDNKMRIRYVNAQYPGSNHDSHIWNVSGAREFFETKQLNGQRNTWILGDAGYALEPWLMTPFRSTSLGSRESVYNTAHSKARNIVERTIGLLKNRFRCLLGARELHYEPYKVSQIVNVSAALHNICLHFRVVDEVSEYTQSSYNSETNDISEHNENVEAARIRQSILNTLT